MAPLISFPNNGTKTKSKINKKHKAFNTFLRLFLGSNDKKINTQGGAVYINGGSGTFDSCSFDGNTARVSTHGYIGFEIECF